LSEVTTSSQAENPYAAPVAELHPQAPHEEQRGAYYAQSPRKAAVMSFVTLGIYDLCFWWRHWRARRARGQDLSVWGRTVFASFYCFEFKNDLTLALVTRDRTPSTMLGWAPVVYLLCNIAQHIIARAHGPSLGALALTFTLIVVRSCSLALFQTEANQVLEADGYRGKYNRGASAGTYLVCVFGVLFWSLALFGSLNPDAPP
jgi:hypothetical protein